MNLSKSKEDALQEIAASLYEKLLSGNAVAKKLDISPARAYSLLRQAGVDVPTRGDERIPQRRVGLTGQKKNDVVLAYQNGMSMREIKRQYGASQQAVYTAIRSCGVPRRPRGGQPRQLSDAVNREIVRLRVEKNLSQAAIAQLVGCGQGTVSTSLKRAGLHNGKNAGGPNHGMWRGGKVVGSGGYVFVKIPHGDALCSMVNSSGYIPEHRLVMARSLGRPLLRDETVHHLNGNKADNRLENLQLRQGKHGTGVVMRCNCCGSHDIATEEI